MNRAVVWLHEETLAGVLRLRGDQRVISVVTEPVRLSIGVVIEGPGLPECEPACYPYSLPPDDYVDLSLRAKLEALLERYDERRHGFDAPDFEGFVREILAGRFDPRTDMPRPDAITDEAR